ncbi:MAG: hypothetical protein HC845_14075 [Akkermansiaceae bacterium]|nr:hypothetical protein [Akkermansiaceae bacterium]
MRKIIFLIQTLVVTFLALAPSAVFAAPPANDNFSTPTIISGFPATVSGTNVDATFETNEPNPLQFNSAEASVWFRWTATTSGPVKIDTENSNFDTILAVWTGNTLVGLSKLGANDDYRGNSKSTVFFNANAGATYQVAVYGYDSERGLIALNISADTSISGRVTGPDGTTPLENISVTAYYRLGNGWEDESSATSDANGYYIIRGLRAGTYRVEFEDWNNRYAKESYNNANNLNAAIDIVVPTGTNVTGIDAPLAELSRVSGRVTGTNGTTPLQGITVTAYYRLGNGWEDASSDTTDANGNYIIRGLRAGTYRVEFEDWNGEYAKESYNNANNLNAAIDIVVPTETNVTGINASLAKFSRVSGRVTGPNGTTPLQGITVTTYYMTSDGLEERSSASTDANGNYAIEKLSVDSYHIHFKGNATYASEFYDNVLDSDSATTVVVPALETTVTGINASLANVSRISGRVTGPDGITPLEDISVTAYRWNGIAWKDVLSRYTDFNGNYNLGELGAGNYRVRFFDEEANFSTEYYNDALTLDSANNIAVPAGTTISGINASLADGPRISGRVTGPDGAPLLGVYAYAYRWINGKWDYESGAKTDAAGNYLIKGLNPGTYRIKFSGRDAGYVDEYHHNSATLDSATSITVPDRTTIAGIDASLAPLSQISGRVTGSDGSPLASIYVAAYRSIDGGWSWQSGVITDANGNYRLKGLQAGNYRVSLGGADDDESFVYERGYLEEYYNDALTLASAVDIIVPAQTNITGIDASLTKSSQISGRVTGPNGATLSEDICIEATVG